VLPATAAAAAAAAAAAGLLSAVVSPLMVLHQLCAAAPAAAASWVLGGPHVPLKGPLSSGSCHLLHALTQQLLVRQLLQYHPLLLRVLLLLLLAELWDVRLPA